MPKTVIVLLIISCIISCKSQEKEILADPIKYVLQSENIKIKRVVDQLNKHQVQIMFTQVDRSNDHVTFNDFKFQVDDENYFYPASTVKFPVAVLALSKLNTIDNCNGDSTFYVEGDSVETTFNREIEKIFAVSDNQSFNRFIEFLGQDYINSTLNNLGAGPVRIAHRLSVPEADEITSKPLIIYENDSTTFTLEPNINTTATALKLNNLTKGSGYYFQDSLYAEPFDFSLKNYYPISTQHEFLKRIYFPKSFENKQKLNLSQEQLSFIHQAMKTVPRNTGYDAATYYDGYCKFFMYGDTHETIPQHLKIYNKVGNAYGTLTDCAYIHDVKNGIEFLITATILTNENGIYNDNEYEYDTIGLPFLAELGRQFYEFELQRKK